MTIKMTQFATYEIGAAATCDGHRKDGGPIVRRPVVSRGQGEIVREAPDVEAKLIALGVAKPARLSEPLASLAVVVMQVDTPLAAVMAAIEIQGVRSWHAAREGEYWYPADAAMGLERDGFSARFRNAGEAELHWRKSPLAIPLFSFATPHGFERAYIWRNRSLLEIATKVNSMKRY